MESTELKSYSLSQLAGSIQSVIRKNYTSEYWIRAEMARINHYPHSGHCYPDLVEKEGNEVKAQMRAIIWASDFIRIQQNFTRLTGKPLQDNIEILFKARVDFNPKFGLSLRITDIDHNFTLGQLLAEKQACIQRLKLEKIYDANKKLPFPWLPQRIAIISVESSKGYHDLLQVIEHNPKGYTFRHSLFPALLQGEKAVKSIIQQLMIIGEKTDQFDLVAIVRGGGGDVGLTAYDHYDLASEICNFPLPILTGIGHSTNETVSEMVAWKNAITPTDLAFFLIAKMEEQEEYISQLARYLAVWAQTAMENEQEKHRQMGKRIRLSSNALIQSHNFQLNKKHSDLQNNIRWQLKKDKERFNHYMHVLHQQNRFLLKKESEKVEQMRKRMPQIRNIIVKNMQQLRYLEDKVRLLNPDNLLKKGYSITLHNGKIIKNGHMLNPGDVLLTKIYNAEIESSIHKIEINDKETDL